LRSDGHEPSAAHRGGTLDDAARRDEPRVPDDEIGALHVRYGSDLTLSALVTTVSHLDMAPQEARRDAAARPASAATVASPARQAIATRWEDIPDELVRDGVRRRGFGNDGVLLVMNELTPGMTVFPHVHEDFDQIATIVSGTAIYYVNGVGHEVGPGSLIL